MAVPKKHFETRLLTQRSSLMVEGVLRPWDKNKVAAVLAALAEH